HMAVARRAVDGVAHVHQMLAKHVDVVDPIGEMAEIAAAGIVLGVPVVSQLDLGVGLAGGVEKDEREPPLFVFDTVRFDKAEALAIEAKAVLDRGNAHHGVKISQDKAPFRFGAQAIRTASDWPSRRVRPEYG